MLWLIETILWLMGGFWGVVSTALFAVETPDGGVITFLLMSLAFALASKVHKKRKTKRMAKKKEKDFFSSSAEIDRLRAEILLLNAQTELELEKAKTKLAEEKRRVTESRRVQCPNCCGTTMVFGRYGTCDYCDSPLTVAESYERPQKTYVNNHERVNVHCARLTEVLKDVGKPMSVSEIVDFMDDDMTSQRCSALLRKLVNDGVVERVEMRRKAYFYIKGA